jgi:hypothetical protein
MKKFLIALFVLAGLVTVASAYDWESQRGKSQRFFVNLAGSAPTSTNMSANFVEPGDIIVDSYNDTVYIVTSKAGGRYVAIASNGLVSVTGGASNSGQITLSGATLTNYVVSLTGTNGVTASVVTNTAITLTYKTNVISSGIVTSAP